MLHSYSIQQEFQKKVAYFSMEFAIDQCLKTYSGGLGFLAGSHMRSAFQLGQHLVGVGMLWTYGYYDQTRDTQRRMRVECIEKKYAFLKDLQIQVSVLIHGAPVHIKAWLLPSNVFQTAPVIFLSTDIDENDHLSRTITHHLYDPNEATKIAQSIVLGIGGAKVLQALQWDPEVYHLNEGHGLPLAYHLYGKIRDTEVLRKKLVFTTHTPEMAGNEERDRNLLEKMGFFDRLSDFEIDSVYTASNRLNYTLGALKLAGKANAVSKVHLQVAQKMWSQNKGICPLIAITNAQDHAYWSDVTLEKAFQRKDVEALKLRKKQLKLQLFKEVANQTGKIFDPDVLTIVWARRFAGYKRSDLLLQSIDRFNNLTQRSKKPIQVIWAGKPYPLDANGIELFNSIQARIENNPRAAVLTGYELDLSALLKRGSDVWLNTPKYPQEASGTSGMSAAMNASLNFSVADGWIPEFIRDEMNGFVIPHFHEIENENQRNEKEAKSLYHVLEQQIISLYYDQPAQWTQMIFNSMSDVIPYFDSKRMATEYYEKLYQ